jgi:hypothetical protein
MINQVDIFYYSNITTQLLKKLSMKDYYLLFFNIQIRTVGFKKNGNCQKKFCQVLLNFYSLKRPFRI